MKTIEQKVYECFAYIYPLESYEQNPRRFRRLLKQKGINFSRIQIERMIKDIKMVKEQLNEL